MHETIFAETHVTLHSAYAFRDMPFQIRTAAVVSIGFPADFVLFKNVKILDESFFKGSQ